MTRFFSKRQGIAAVLCTILVGCSIGFTAEVELASAAGRGAAYFEQNIGQFPDQVRFRFRSETAVVWFSDQGLWQSFPAGEPDPVSGLRSLQYAYLSWPGASPDAVVKGRQPLQHYSNYFRGNDPTKWYREVPHLAEIVYEDLYPNIDLVYRFADGRLKYDFVVRPGGDPADIRFAVDGVDQLTVEEGSAVLWLKTGRAVDAGLVAYQVNSTGVREQVDVSFVEVGEDCIRFDVGSYDRTRELVIDPIVEFITYHGGDELDKGFGVDIDESGYIYMVGTTNSTDFPVTTGTIPASDSLLSGNKTDCFVSKFSPDGQTLVYSTYIGGDGNDYANAVAVRDGFAYVTGETRASNPGTNPFPTTVSSYQTSFRGGLSDAFVIKLPATGTGLVYSTFLGGSIATSSDVGEAIAVDTDGHAYVCGWTGAVDFPATHIGSPPGQSSCAFLVKVEPDGSGLIYGRKFGGSGDDRGQDIALMDNEHVVMTGFAASAQFPTTTLAYDTTKGATGGDAFVLKVDADGDTLFSTYLGGDTAPDEGWGVAVLSNGNICVTGWTRSTDFPVAPSPGLSHEIVFVSTLSGDGSSLFYSTLFGGSGDDRPTAIGIDDLDQISICGYTESSDFPVNDSLAFDLSAPNTEGFIVRLLTSRGPIVFSSFIGGDDAEDYAEDIAVTGDGEIAVAGWTASDDFPLENARQSTFGGGNDAFLALVVPSNCCVGTRGNANGDPNDFADLSDLTYLVNYLFLGGPLPVCWWEANADGDASEQVDLSDLIYLTNYLFQGGPQPAACP